MQHSIIITILSTIGSPLISADKNVTLSFLHHLQATEIMDGGGSVFSVLVILAAGEVYTLFCELFPNLTNLRGIFIYTLVHFYWHLCTVYSLLIYASDVIIATFSTHFHIHAAMLEDNQLKCR